MSFSNSELEKNRRVEPFTLYPTNKFNNKAPYFRKPCEVGYFSLDGDRSYHDDSSQLRHYSAPTTKQFHFDLRKGYDSYVEKDDDVKERLTHLLMWISKHKEVFRIKDQSHDDVR